MKHRESLFKENIDIKRVLSRGSIPVMKRIKDKFQNNKKKITLFLVFCGVLNFYPAYTLYLQYVPRIEIQKMLREVFLGPQELVSIRESQFNNKLKIELMKEFLEMDRQLNFGFTRRLIIKAFKEMQVSPSKENKQEFYNNSGNLDKVLRAKLSSVNIKEFQTILESTYKSCRDRFQSFDQFQVKFLESLQQVQTQEEKYQNSKSAKLRLKLSSIKIDDDLKLKGLPMRLKLEVLKQNLKNQPNLQEQMAALRQQIRQLSK